jgi:hypothetical protein
MTDVHNTLQEEDLVIAYGHGQASILIHPSHTLAHVRTLMREEFDNEMFPQQDSEQWSFWVNDSARITRKQEGRKVAWQYLTGHALSIRSTGAAKRAPDVEVVAATAPTAKRTKVVEALVTNASDTTIEKPFTGQKSSGEGNEATLVENPIVQLDLAFEKTKANFRIVDAILDDVERNQRAFSEARRNACSQEVKRMLNTNRPQTIIGVYGSSGV